MSTNISGGVTAPVTSRTATSDPKIDPTIDPDTGVERTPTPALVNLFEAPASSTGQVLLDIGRFTVGTHRDEDGLVGGTWDQAGTSLAVTGTVATAGGLTSIAKTLGAREAVKLGNVALGSGKGLLIGGLLVTPYLASAVVGTAVADAATYATGGLVPSYKKLTSITSTPERKKAEEMNKWVPAIRGAVGGAVTGLIGLGLFAWKPQWFKKAGVAQFSKTVAAVADAQAGAGLMSLSGGFKDKVKKIAGTVALVGGVTAVPGATAASKYYSITDDFDQIVAPRSPFVTKR
ncbi:MAG: hypothetical protein JWO69_1738 [Thermoleophilia bacterium]|jgi:hypothetical protein|nr:hypothetical protein [Thermoleophilia bacterium]